MLDALRDSLPCTVTMRALRPAMGMPIPVDSGRQSCQAYLTNWMTDPIIGILPLLMEQEIRAATSFIAMDNPCRYEATKRQSYACPTAMKLRSFKAMEPRMTQGTLQLPPMEVSALEKTVH
jgi:hypothetical protein